ncbi:YwdI family protein [Halobacillus sp. ACCC02827]|uniref:YwdI family protein n=1 Tax=Bacillaceae TaxID=186817 RepID=UPI0004291EC7|nr:MULTISPECIES: YwdI family protein [Bacillaceae]QHT48215.1 YwdI family protein [Bacillus sp. SB49]WJE15448.1 YwdI family protein [Halobacillus sp. ACCC02827]
MAITNQTVLKKMSNEIQEAMLQYGDEQKVREHVRSIRLLADLLLEEEPVRTEAPVQEPTAEEVRRMMGVDAPSRPDQQKKVDHGEANGPSIFDF